MTESKKIVLKLPRKCNITQYPAIACSQDNQFSINTDEGIYTIEPRGINTKTVPGLTFAMNIIRAPTKCKTTRVPTKIPNDKSKIEKAFGKMFDSTDHYVGFKRVAWSPKGCTSITDKCFLAVLGMDHEVSLYVLEQDEWIKKADLSPLFKQYMSSQTKGSGDKKVVTVNGPA